MPKKLFDVGLRVTGRGAIRTLNQFSASAANAGRATEKFERSTKNLTVALGSLGGYFGVRQLVEYADTWTLINARIRIVTKTQEQANAVHERIYKIAQRTRNTLAATAVLYTRTALNADQLGRSHEELLIATEAVNSALLISGATGVEAAQSMRQLAQALGSGRLQGDEFRTVMEAMPLVARAIADEMGVAVGQLKDLSKDGLIDVQTVLDALIKKNDQWREQIENMPFTVGQAFEILNNSVTRMIGILNFAIGITDGFSDVIRKAADNMNKIVAAVVALTAASIAYKIQMIAVSAIVTAFTGATAILNWIRTVAQVRNMAQALAVAGAAARGLVGPIALILSLTAGYLAFQKVLDQIDKATAEWVKNQADLNEQLGAGVDIISDAELKIIRETEAIKRLAYQQLILSATEEDQQKLQEIGFDAINKRIEARQELEGQLLLDRLEAIDLEEKLLVQAEKTTQVFEKLNDIIKERTDLIQRFVKNLQTEFANIFESVFEQGIKRFGDLFDAIKKLFFRLIAEMAAASVVNRIAEPFKNVLNSVFAGTPAALAAQEAVDIARREAINDITKRGAGIDVPEPTDDAAPVQVMVLEYSSEAERSLSQTIASFLGPVMAGFFTGRIIGGLTSNTTVGALGGAGGGALAGASLGAVIPGVGPVGGAIAGGIAGAIGGFIGASERQREESERLRRLMEQQQDILAANNLRLEELRDAFNGVVNRNLLAFRGFRREPFAGQSDGSIMSGIRTFFARGAYNQLRDLDPTTRQSLLALAGELGITILGPDGRVLPEAFSQLHEAIELTIRSMTEWGNNIDDITRRQKAFNVLFDVEDTPEQLLKDTYEILSLGAPELLRQFGLQNLNLDSPQARAALIEGLREIFNFIDAGGLFNDPDLLGAFANKNELIDAIINTKEAFDNLNRVLFDFTTDFPRALKLALFQQQYGQGAVTTPITSQPINEIIVHGGITIVNESDDTGEDILQKLEDAVAARRMRGGSVDLDNIYETSF